MRAVLTSNATSDRLADAALLLLDAARAAVADHRSVVSAGSPTSSVMALSVQALIMADHWPAGGMQTGDVAFEPQVLIESLCGGGVGLGLIAASVIEPGLRGRIIGLIGRAVGEGETLGLGLRQATKDRS